MLKLRYKNCSEDPHMSMIYSKYNTLSLSIDKDSRAHFLYHDKIGMFAKDITVSFSKADGTVVDLSDVPSVTYDRKLQTTEIFPTLN